MDFCFKILDTIKQFNSFTFGTNFTMKIGFNYGPVTDGIIGQNKVSILGIRECAAVGLRPEASRKHLLNNYPVDRSSNLSPY
jgi:hypothetical protein